MEPSHSFNDSRFARPLTLTLACFKVAHVYLLRRLSSFVKEHIE